MQCAKYESSVLCLDENGIVIEADVRVGPVERGVAHFSFLVRSLKLIRCQNLSKSLETSRMFYTTPLRPVLSAGRAKCGGGLFRGGQAHFRLFFELNTTKVYEP